MAGADVHVVAAIAIIAASFLLGHFTQSLQDGGVHQQQETSDAPIISNHLQRRDMQEGSPALLDPLDTPKLEQFMLETSGILSKRPPIQAAGSGDDFVRVIPFQILSWAPRLVVFPAFIDKARCEAIMRMSNASLQKSGLAWKPSDEDRNDADQEVRTSSGTFLSSDWDNSSPLAWLEERIAAATLIPASHGEAFNILKYESTQHYDSHMDAFDPKEYGPQASQRIASFLVYLTAPEEGGETIFKRQGWAHGDKPISDYRSCGDGYKYQPRQGDGILFYNTYADNSIDPHSLHGGCPVVKGEKWVATRWLRNLPIGRDRAAELEEARRQQASAQ
ncbi:hypothetical protein V8C86DRAFT_2508092 [Haematococcus lacustris]